VYIASSVAYYSKWSACPDSNAQAYLTCFVNYSNNNRGSAQYTAEGDIVYPAGALGVVFNPAPRGGQGGTQRFFNGHTDSITALACGVHCSEAVPGGRTLVATGQLGKRPKVTRLL
jgi:hypothetical protein